MSHHFSGRGTASCSLLYQFLENSRRVVHPPARSAFLSTFWTLHLHSRNSKLAQYKKANRIDRLIMFEVKSSSLFLILITKG